MNLVSVFFSEDLSNIFLDFIFRFLQSFFACDTG